MSLLGMCDCCQVREAVHHVTLRVEIQTPARRKIKIVQFGLCELCERDSQDVLMSDAGQESRVAKRFALVERGEWKALAGSRSPRW